MDRLNNDNKAQFPKSNQPRCATREVRATNKILELRRSCSRRSFRELRAKREAPPPVLQHVLLQGGLQLPGNAGAEDTCNCARLPAAEETCRGGVAGERPPPSRVARVEQGSERASGWRQRWRRVLGLGRVWGGGRWALGPA